MVTSETRCKHLTDEDRQSIQDGLNNGCSFKHIARRIGKDPTMISKEVKKHLDVRPAKPLLVCSVSKDENIYYCT